MMRRFMIAGLLFLLILLISLTVTVFALTKSVHADRETGSSVKMYQGTFNDQTLPTDGTVVQLASIPFSTTLSGQVAGTALVDLIIGDPNSFGAGGGSGTIEELSCTLKLDGTTFGSFDRVWHGATITRTVAINAVTTVAQGSHTVTLSCSVPNFVSGMPMTVGSEGITLIVAQG